MISPDLDISKLTPTEARTLLYKECAILEGELGYSFAQALEAASLQNPKLMERIKAATPTAYKSEMDTALANSGVPPMPVFSPQMKLTLGLSASADDEECKAAWMACKGATTPPDYQAIWKTLLALTGGRKGVPASSESVKMDVARAHPQLALAVGYQLP